MAEKVSLQRGMTLMEIMIAVVIMGVVASLAVPSYRNSVETARSNEATTNLNIIYTAQKIYKVDNGVFWAGGTCSTTNGVRVACATLNGALGIDIGAEFYNLAVANDSSATATRNVGGSTKVYTISTVGSITSVGNF